MESLNPIERETARRLRVALVQPIPQRVADEHLSEMRAARRRPRGWSTVLAAAAALLVAGAATALPGAADPPDVVDADRPPVNLPHVGAPAWVGNQGLVGPLGNHDSHGETVSGIARDSGLQGKEHGDQVSDAASSKSVEHRKDGERRPVENPVGKSTGSGDGGKPSDTPPRNGTGKPEDTPGYGPGGP